MSLIILRLCECKWTCFVFSLICVGASAQRFPVCQWQWCHMASYVDCIHIVCCVIRARIWGVTLASSLIPANSCVPGSPAPQAPADASTLSELHSVTARSPFTAQWEERDQLVVKYLSLLHWLRAFSSEFVWIIAKSWVYDYKFP